MTILLGAALLSALLLAHRLRLDRVAPAVAATIWLSALALRALGVLFVGIFVALRLPTTGRLELVGHQCWHAVLPVLTTHLMLEGHSLADAAIAAPGFVLAVSVIGVVAGVARAARSVRRLLAAATLPGGPQGTLILRTGAVMVAAAGLARPRVVVSAGALTELDDEELDASLDHERGHIARRHRFVLLLAELLRTLGRWVPGTRAAHRELLFHLERDADAWALARRHDPLALASAICKAAGVASDRPALTALGGACATRRVGELLDGPSPPARSRPAIGAATAMVALVLLLTAVIAPAALAGIDRAHPSVAAPRHCLD